ncbi:TonB-dependent receptor domain-containing protein [Hymenobacter sp. GOD-10R]|uniref:TonB-dependent receptor domain-containing protein n=1 Tax=Hymenobacter sp. GOD-10R TaxID=3093922 RepID=UPI002D77925C|nr:TonB-dependent receptor [Hymenobacter sp. GOD-10R]WRQ29855.1 TonB-dependent receptor [Hymenobacter sp. GOD-10R]
MKQTATLCLLLATLAPGVRAQTTTSLTASASSKGPGVLRGNVRDGASQKPIEYATVTLLPLTGTTPLASTTCDDKGHFELKQLPKGAFRLQVTFVGYTPRIEPVTITDQAADLGTLTLTASTQKLGEVTVTGQRPLVETKPDRLVYNAEQDATNAGGTATDVLRKTPMLNVDVDGNVQLRGTSNLRILINNKPSAMLAGNLADALKQIPADQIKAIEVVTSPSAKYDAEGSGGVINIVLKKSSLQGVNGSVGASGGNRNQSTNGSLNVRRGKLGVNSRLSVYRNSYPYRSSLNRTDFTPTGEGQLEQRTESRSTGRGGYGQVELVYEPSPLHSFTLSGNGNLYLSRSPQNLFNQYIAPPIPPGGSPFAQRDTLYSRDIEQRYEGHNYDFNAGYTRTYGEAHPRREWSMLAQHTRSTNTGRYSLDQYHDAAIENGPLEYRERSTNLARNLETTLQTDYTHPTSEKNTLEAGAKVILRQVSSDYSLDTLLLAKQPDFVRSPRRSNAFNYQQNVASAYSTYSFSMGKKYAFTLGARLEGTSIEGDFLGNESRFTNQYLNLLPNLNVTRNLKKPGHTLRMSFSRRIQRPNIYYLNPYVNQTTPNNVYYGNPNLSPEFTNSYELSYSTFNDKASLNASVYVRRTGNSIERYNIYNEALARTESTYGNLATNSSYGLSLYGSLKPIPAWNISSNLNPSYMRLYSAALNRTNSRFNLNMSLNSSLKLGKLYTIQAFGGGGTGGVMLQSRYSGYMYYSMGLKRTLLKEKADLTLNANNFLQPGRRFRSSTTTDQFVSSSISYQYQRSFNLSFNYRFGKLDNNSMRQRRSIRNDDSKGGGSTGGSN